MRVWAGQRHQARQCPLLVAKLDYAATMQGQMHHKPALLPYAGGRARDRQSARPPVCEIPEIREIRVVREIREIHCLRHLGPLDD